MADRLKFRFLCMSEIARTGTCEIDVENPIDEEEIRTKLQSLDFVSFLVQDQEHVNERWQFKPDIPEVVNDNEDT